MDESKIRHGGMNIAERLRLFFGEENYSFGYDMHTVWVVDKPLGDALAFLKNQLSFIMLLDICGVDQFKTGTEKRFEIVFHLLNMEYNQRLRVKSAIDEVGVMDSTENLWAAATWYQREIWDMYGIGFHYGADSRLLTHKNFIGHPLRKDFFIDSKCPLTDSDEMYEEEKSIEIREELYARETINIGPIHPSTKGALRIKARIEGEIVRDSLLEIGYLHRGIEKVCEQRNYQEITKYVSHLNECSPLMNSIGWCRAVEEMLQITIPERAIALRMLLAELSRIDDHFQSIGIASKNVGASIVFTDCMRARKIIDVLLDKYMVGRVNHSLVCIGGLKQNIPVDWISDCFLALNRIIDIWESVNKFLTRSRIWMERSKTGQISAKDAISWGYTGPCLRATGINYDVRKRFPYYLYDQMNFEIPLGYRGNVYDRYLVRMEEIRQSVSIVEQLLNDLPVGNVVIGDDFKKQGKIIVDSSEIYSFSEVANGELGYYIVSDGGEVPFRVKVRTPSYPIVQSLPHLCRDISVMDLLVSVDSLNIIPGEVDR